MKNNKGISLWCILFIIFMLASGILLYSLLAEITRRVQVEDELASVQEEKINVEDRLNQTQLELITLKDEANLLEQQLAKEKETVLTTLAKLESKDIQITELERTLDNEKKQKESLTNNLAQLRDEHASLEKELQDAHLRLQTLESQIGKNNEEKANVKLEKIVIKPAAPTAEVKEAPVKPAKQLNGKVLVVNREFNFVVIDIGKKDGANIGNQLAVYQDSQEIATIQIEKLYDTMATAVILPGSQTEKLKENNTVKSF